MTERQPYAVRISTPASKVLDTLPERDEDMVWDVLVAAGGDPFAFRQWNTDDPEGEDVRHISFGRLSLTCWATCSLRCLSVLTITWLGQPPVQALPRHRLAGPERFRT